MLNNTTMMDMMQSVDTEPLWSILDQKGTQTMMRGVLGDAAQLADYESVKKRLLSFALHDELSEWREVQPGRDDA